MKSPEQPADEPRDGEGQAGRTPEVVLLVSFGEHVPKLPYRAGPELDKELGNLLGTKLETFRKEYPGAVFGPRYTAVAPDVLEALSAKARERTPGSKDPGFRRTFELRVPGAKDVRRLESHIAQWGELVSHVSRPAVLTLAPLDLNPGNDAAANKLHYQKPAQRTVPAGVNGALVPYDWGVDAEYAWSIDKGKGEFMAVVDVEMGWNLDHDDLKPVNIQRLPAGNAFVNGDVTLDKNGKMTKLEDSKAHGTCVLGILVGATAGDGVTGIANRAPLVAVAGEYHVGENGAVVPRPEPHNAIIAALAKLEEFRAGGGGVLLIETSEDWGWYDKTLGETGAPIELRAEVHKEILEAGNLLHTVVEAAGNGGLDLDALDYAMTTIESGDTKNPPALPVNIADPDVNDSKAVLVGSTNPPVDKDGLTWKYKEGVDGRHRRRPSSCFGERVDCSAWGDYVQSSSGTPAEYAQFNGTSSAAAVVAGVVLLMQGIWKEHGDSEFLTPAEVREILRDETLGTPVWDDAGNTQVGHIPDLRKILTTSAKFAPLGLVPDVFLRDHVGDDGDPHDGAIASSPDIIVKQAAEPDPGGAWDQDSPDADAVDLGDPVLGNHQHHVYVRARNRGKALARGAVAKVYWSKVATLITPGMWNEVGTGGAVFDPIPRGDALVVSRDLVWPADPTLTEGHYCFVALVGADGDPAPDPNAFAGFAEYKQFIRDVNNATWRNFNVVELAPGAPEPMPLPFGTPGAFDEDREFALQILIDDPERVRVELELPQDTFQRFGAPVHGATANAHAGTVRFATTQLAPGHAGSFLLGTGVLPKYDAKDDHAEEPAAMTLHVTLRDPAPPGPSDVAVVQLHEGQEVGRVTWRIRPRAAANGIA